MNQSQFISFVKHFFASSDWSLFAHCAAALCFKHYDSAVGSKEAQIYFGQDEFTWVLFGVYQSEGCNILSTASVLIPKDCTTDQLIEYCSQFLTGVETAIANSYAVRLL
ncbi:MAG: hypothetical protein KGZ80_04575 [Methylomonas sp.]|nr:hypothetical protein [Methylomonas sp.]